MKVLHVVTGPLNGGAARGVTALVEGLRANGVHAEVFFLKGGAANDWSVKARMSVIENFVQRGRGAFWRLIKKFYRLKKDYNFSRIEYGLSIDDVADGYDIIHLHWINGFLDLRSLSSISAPLVITLRDMWFFTGGCHYSLSCDGYVRGCTNCPAFLLKSGLPAKNCQMKAEIFSHRISWIAISTWLAEKAALSTVLGQKNIRVIKNAVTLAPFTRDFLLEFEGEKIHIICGAQNLEYGYKGSHILVSILNKLDPQVYDITIFGKTSGNFINRVKRPINAVGFIDDEMTLVKLYQSSQIFLFTSTQEAFGKTIVEAMASGLIVLAGAGSGPDDIIDDGIDGFLIDPLEPDKYVEVLERVRRMPLVNKQMVSQAAQRKSAQYEPKKASMEYVSLYDEILGN